MVAGLGRKRWTDAVEDFVQQHGHLTPRWAVCLTYDISLDVLARKVLPTLARRGRVFRTVVLADHGALEKALAVSPDALRKVAEGRAALNLHPVQCKGTAVFHPKLVLLRAGPRVRACYGSANLTAGGLGGNLELWTHTDEVGPVAGLVHFLQRLSSAPDVDLDAAARRNLGRALVGLQSKPHAGVWNSIDEPFRARLRRGPERQARRTWVLSPLYATPSGLLQARACLPPGPVVLHTDGATRLPGASVHVYAPPSPADEELSMPAMQARLHAKAFVFETPAGVQAWTGSANFTAQALTRTAAKAGNVELLVRTTLQPPAWKALKEDLRHNFEATKGAAHASPDREPRQSAKGAIVAGEIQGSPAAPRLILLVRPRVRSVVICSGEQKLRLAVLRRRAAAEGKDLLRVLGAIDLQASQAFLLWQQAGANWVPFVVNVPHVPEAEEGNHRAVDALLDELLGRVARQGFTESLQDDDGEEPTSDDLSEEDAAERSARPLDEVRHQGELDRLAVKVALLRRLVSARGGGGLNRRALEREALSALQGNCAKVHWPTVRRLFLGRRR